MPAKAASGRGESKGKDGKAGKAGKKEPKGAASRNEREVYVEGNLEKRCEGNMLRKWQTRYCVFSSKGLAYFKSKDDYVAKKEAGTLIPVASFKNCAVNGLEIMLHAQDRTLLFRAGDADDCEEWAMYIHERIAANRSADFGSCGIGDEDTRFWAETVKPVNLGGLVQDFALCKVFKDTDEWSQVLAHFSKSMPRESLVRCMRLQHKSLLEAHRKFRAGLEGEIALDLDASVSKAVSTRKVFHGATSVANTASILRTGFREPHKGKGGGVLQFGRGCYFARDAALAARYSAQVDASLADLIAENPHRLVGTKCMILANMVVGDMAVGSHDRPQAPKIPSSACGRRYDTLTDKEGDPLVLVSTDDAQCYPAYLLCFSTSS